MTKKHTFFTKYDDVGGVFDDTHAYVALDDDYGLSQK
jgi:hypothetical protein